jgi:hypothetical protein
MSPMVWAIRMSHLRSLGLDTAIGRLAVVVGGVEDNVVRHGLEGDALEVGGGDLEGVEEESGALVIDGVADYGVGDLHKGALDAVGVLEGRKAVEAGRGAVHVVVGVAVGAVEQGGRAAADAVGLDVLAARRLADLVHATEVFTDALDGDAVGVHGHTPSGGSIETKGLAVEIKGSKR